MSAGIERVAASASTNSIKAAHGGSAPASRHIGIPPLLLENARVGGVMKLSPTPEAAPLPRDQFWKEESEEESEVTREIDETNRQMALSNRSLRFRIDRKTEELQIQVVDVGRDRVIRSIPPDEMLRLAARIRELFGIGAMVDQSR